MKVSSVTVALSLCGLLAGNVACANPRLLQTYPVADGQTSGTGPLTFVFSEPMDAASIRPPHGIPNSLNSDRSYDVLLFGNPTEGYVPGAIGGDSIVLREGGRMVESPGASIKALATALRVFQNGFHSVHGGPLDRDYFLPIYFCDGCKIDVAARAAFPTAGQAVSDPTEPISVYFDQPVNRDTFQVELRSGVNGSPIGPLTFAWDLPGLSLGGPGMTRVTIQHPALTPSPRPYRLSILHLSRPDTTQDTYWSNPILPEGGMSITVGTALAGDLNGDGDVTLADAILALQGAVGLISLTEAQRFAADVSPSNGANGLSVGDGRVDLTDVQRILQRTVGLTPGEQWP